MRTLVLCGDGYLGWPMALHLSARGFEVAVVDNLTRRKYDEELGTSSLIPIRSLEDRIERWRSVGGKPITAVIGDLTEPEVIEKAVVDFKPDSIVHFAEQRAAPYSMIDQKHAVYTQVNNVVGTLNVLYTIGRRDPSIHLVKLGTM